MNRTVRMTAEVSLTYAPDYLAHELGFFAEEGIDLVTDFGSGPGGSWLANNLADGKAEIARGGIWIPIMNRGVLETVYPFAMLCDRNSQLLLSREPIDDFRWEDLYDRRVLISAGATSQWMFLDGVLTEAGVDKSRISFVRDLHVDTTVRLWRAGYADFYLSSPPLCDVLLDEGFHLAGGMAELGGRVPWSIYYASQAFLDSEDHPAHRFTRAISRGKEWLEKNSVESAARLLHKHFPDFTEDVIARSLDRMRRDGVWTRSVTIPPAPLARYQDIMVGYGLVDRSVPYSELVESRPAAAVDGPLTTNTRATS